MELLNQILSRTDCAYALTDDRLTIMVYSNSFTGLNMSGTSLKGKNICDIVPEFIGLESTFTKISSQKAPALTLPFINKNDTVYTCTIEHCENKKGGLLITFCDVSSYTALKQQIVQKENEIHILKARLNTKSKQAASSIIGNSPSITKLKEIIPRIAQINASSILLEGETGTGKSMLASVIHNASPNAEMPFVEINCASIPETLLEAELFGAVKGAYTNAATDRIGLIESADGGTLFLDEIGELPLNLQAKLLSFLETRKFRPLGSNKEKKVQLRLITATNKNLENEVEEGSFREDLFYRLSIVPIKMTPLRNMGDDVLLLAEFFIDQFNRSFKKRVKGLASSAQDKLRQHSWPGNVRELSNCIEQTMIFKDTGLIQADDILLRNIKSNVI